MIDESLKHPTYANPRWRLAEVEAHDVEKRLQAGERSGALVSAIVNLVAPKLTVEAYDPQQRQFRKRRKRPKTVRDIFEARLTSGTAINPASLHVHGLIESSFIVSLANALDAAVTYGLDIARRMGSGQEHSEHLWLRRVYYVSKSERAVGMDEPDSLGEGIGPSVKLLHAVVWRLVDIDHRTAVAIICRWKRSGSPIHLRLWAAISRNPKISLPADIGEFLCHLDFEVFWDVLHHPEIAELRARRFSELDAAAQRVIARRIRRGPPRRLWREFAEPDRIEEYRTYWVVRELKRIEIAGAALPTSDKTWLEGNIGRFADLAEMDRVDEGFLDSPRAHIVPPDPDRALDSLEGTDRLRALERAFNSPRRAWHDAPAERARDWLREEGNALLVLGDIQSIPDGGAELPRVWEEFCKAHSPPSDQAQKPDERDLPAEASRTLNRLVELPDGVILQAVEGISDWLSSWEQHMVNSPNGLLIWRRVWPFSVEATNAMQPRYEEPDLNVMAWSTSGEPRDLDTLNTPVGKLVGVFLAACPNLDEEPRPFNSSGDLANMRDAIIDASGRSGLIATHRLVEYLGYFLHADREWTESNLIAPLRVNDAGAITLWRAIGRHTRFTNVLQIIGNEMADRTTDPQLGRRTRDSLAFSIVIESLNALWEGREPAVTHGRVQQMIRSLDEEVRAHCVRAITRFVSDRSELSDDPLSSENLFQSAAKPFLQKVWPQERSLTSPGISHSLANLPATARGRFAEAVEMIKRFLVPIECRSMRDYGLHEAGNHQWATLAMIDDETKANALLCLLGLTIRTDENAVIPYDLGDALARVRDVAPNLTRTPEYGRLATAARRVRW